jgi:hypothetical protein
MFVLQTSSPSKIAPAPSMFWAPEPKHLDIKVFLFVEFTLSF